MKLSDINKAIISQAKKHFEQNCNDEASRNLVLSGYFAEEYDLTNDEAEKLLLSPEHTIEEYFYRWYYFNIVNKFLIPKPKKKK